MVLCGLLAGGILLCVQPPFLFPKEDESEEPVAGNSSFSHNVTMLNGTTAVVQPPSPYTSDYYFGVFLALGCAVCGSLCNITISRVGGDVSSSALVFYGGVAGMVVAVAGSFAEREAEHVMFSLGALSLVSWGLILAISTVGVVGYLTYTASLKSITPTSVSVIRALEIVLAYFCQVRTTHLI